MQSIITNRKIAMFQDLMILKNQNLVGALLAATGKGFSTKMRKTRGKKSTTI